MTQKYSRPLLQIVTIIFLFLAACTKKDLQLENATKSTKTKSKKTNLIDETLEGLQEDGGLSGSSPQSSLTRYVVDDNFRTSISGDIRIEVKIWADETSGQHNHLAVSVDPDFVVIGGGGRIRSLDNKVPDLNINALLSASYPLDDNTFSTWVADSKDHEEVYPHRLITYAIGLKVYHYSTVTADYIPFPASVIKNLMGMSHVTAPFQNGQELKAYVPNGNTGFYSVVCGGGRFTWPYDQSGLLLTKVASGENFGSCMGKDHAITTLGGTQEAFCIYINNRNPLNPSEHLLDFTESAEANNPWETVDDYDVQISQNLQTMSHSVYTLPNTSFSGYLIGSLGGWVTYNGFGRMMYSLFPKNGITGELGTKDHLEVDISGRMNLRINGVRPHN